jgi:hypothetical protein
MTSKRTNTMAFVCTQNWNDLRRTENGRYCTGCKKEVFDFTHLTTQEVNKLEKGVCGVFLPEQVEEGLRPISFNSLKRARNYITTLATLIGLESQALRAQTVKSQSANTEVVSFHPSENSSSKTVSAPIDSSHNRYLTEDDPLEKKKAFMQIGRRYFYWTKKFPFLVSRRHWMGTRF